LLLEYLKLSLEALGAVAALIAALIAWFQLRAASRQVTSAARQARRESEDRNRPYVFVDVVPGLSGNIGVWDLVITNMGGSAASEVRIVLMKDRYRGGSGSYLATKLEKMENTVFTLVPKAHKRMFWIIDRPKSEMQGAPLIGEIKVSYKWNIENENQRIYTEVYPYDVTNFPYPAASTGSVRQGNDTDAQLKNIEYALRKISVHIAELRR
jgi:hypothetical protein